MIPIKPQDSSWTDEQWKAIHLTGKNIIVSAGAGSGKTAVLTERIINKIKNGVSIQDMIVLTFTNAAAKEMKDRVRKQLVKEAKKDKSLEKQLHLIDGADITTFDAYSLSLLKKYHYLLGIDNNINIIDNVVLSNKKKLFLDEIIDSYYENIDFLNLLDIYTNKDDIQIKNAIISIYDKMGSICKKNDYLSTYIDKYFNNEFINKNIEKYLKIIESNSNTITNLVDTIKNTITNEELLIKVSEKLDILDNLNYSKKYDDYKKIAQVFTMPTLRKSKKVEQDDIDEIKSYLEKLKSYTEELKALTLYSDLNEIIEEINSNKTRSQVFVDILKQLDNKLLEYKKQSNTYEFSDITSLVISLLEDNEKIRNEIKYKTNEIMIDEYQDTNDIGDYFISLISNNNVYMVGDVKQSIYRFRNANPKIFMEKYNNYKKEVGGYAIDLNKNFRSRKEVLDSINLIFNHIMDEEIGGANYTNGHNMIFGNDKYISKGSTKQNYDLEIYNYDYKNIDSKIKYSKDEIEAFIIADDILDKVNNNYQIFDVKTETFHNASFNDFVILIDKKTKFDLFKKIFDYKKIPIIVHKDEEFVYSSEIYVLKNLLKLVELIKYKKNNEIEYPFTSVARSYLFSYLDNDIFEAITNKDIINNIVFKELFDKINNIVLKVDNYSISNLLLEIYNEFDMYLKSVKIGDVVNINKKLDYIVTVATNLEEIGYGLKEFTSYFDDIFDQKIDIQFSNKKDTSSNSVNIMTIHKSKGLEYPVCYFPILHSNFNKADLNDRFIFDVNYGIIMPVFKEGLTSTIYKRLLTEDYLKEDISERLRVLYVALTRAKEKIILINSLDSDEVNLPFENNIVNNLERQKYNNFGKVLSSIKQVILKYVVIKETNVDRNYLKKISQSYKEQFITTDFKYNTKIINFDKNISNITKYSHSLNKIEKNNEMDLGNKVHEVLEYLDFSNYKNDLNNYELDEDIKNQITKLFDQPFMSNLNKIHKEYEFYYNNSNGIIDLLIETDDKIIIVDYKLNDISKPYYVDQVKGYIEYVKTITSKEVEGYLYSVINSEYKKIKI